MAPLAAEHAIEITARLIDLACISNGLPVGQPKPKICFDEWNVWSPIRAPGSMGAEEKYTLSDALAVGVWLNVFVRRSKDVAMACLAQSVNAISPLMTTKEGIMKQTTWWPLWLFCRFMKGETISVHVFCEAYQGKTARGWWLGMRPEGGGIPWLDVAGCVNREGWVSVCVVNINEEKDWECNLMVDRGKLDSVGERVRVYIMRGRNPGVTNLDGVEEVKVEEGIWDGKGLYTFPRHSLTMLRWKTSPPLESTQT